jgi:NAD(P)-dependent dehydrogenase (short-subunit alcohol dehydrogenase family)
MDLQLAGKAALVTGSTAGIGLAIWGEQKRDHGGDFVWLTQPTKGAHRTD